MVGGRVKQPARTLRQITSSELRSLCILACKELLIVVASSEHDAVNRLTDPQMRTLVKRFKDFLEDNEWSFEDNGPRSSW